MSRYRDAIGYIDSLSSRGWVFGLKGIKGILNRIGNPEKGLRCIHIAGTNGKGSVAKLIHDILNTHGLKVGLYTSPHILSFRERIVVGEKKIGRDELSSYVEDIRKRIDGYNSFTYFDFTTALAFRYFRDVGVDIAVVEVGLGGRLDSTNVVVPEVSVITRISYDHMDVLGNTLKDIAKEKAGIIKEGVPVVALRQNDEVESVIKGVAEEKGSRLYTTGLCEGDLLLCGDLNSLTYQGLNFSLYGIDASNLPFFQVENMVLSLGVMDVLGLSLEPEKVRGVISSFQVPGRFEVFREAGRLFIFDVGHNESCMATLKDSITRFFGDRKFTVVMGALRDKDVRGMLAAISPVSERFFFIPLPSPRACDPQELLKVSRDLGLSVEAFDNPVLAIRKALSSKDLLFTGSFYTVMVAKKVLMGLCGEFSR